MKNVKKERKTVECERLAISSGNTKGTFHARMGMIKDRNGKDLTKAEGIKKRCKNTQNYTRKALMTQITMMVWSLT